MNVKTTDTIAISDFVRRQTKDSEFSYFDGTDFELLARLSVGIAKDHVKRGYRDGVLLVSVNPVRFYTSVVSLREGDKLVGEFKARREGEDPVKTTRVVGAEKTPAGFVDVVLYHKDVLAEGNERSTDADWEVISINARPDKEEMPINPGALMRNYFCEAGGTDTKMTAEEFVEQLKISRDYWRDKALLHSE